MLTASPFEMLAYSAAQVLPAEVTPARLAEFAPHMVVGSLPGSPMTAPRAQRVALLTPAGNRAKLSEAIVDDIDLIVELFPEMFVVGVKCGPAGSWPNARVDADVEISVEGRATLGPEMAIADARDVGATPVAEMSCAHRALHVIATLRALDRHSALGARPCLALDERQRVELIQ